MFLDLWPIAVESKSAVVAVSECSRPRCSGLAEEKRGNCLKEFPKHWLLCAVGVSDPRWGETACDCGKLAE
eukprot:15440527-Alexandrium_andersonii.AAC.1